MSTAQLPQIPALPTSPAPTWEQRMRDFEARMSIESYEQAERAITASQAVAAASQAVAAANTALRDVQEAARLVMVLQAEAAERMVELLQAQPDAPPVVTPAGDEPALVALVASMTSTQRGNPVAAAAAAKAQLQAIRGA